MTEWRTVPAEPTEEMVKAAWVAGLGRVDGFTEQFLAEYQAALAAAPAPVALTDEEERAAFEKWKSNDGQWPELLERYPNGDYNRCATVNAWEVWQARALLARTGEAK